MSRIAARFAALRAEGRGALICYESDGTPVRMDIRFNRSFRLFWSPVILVIPGWKPWKTPA